MNDKAKKYPLFPLLKRLIKFLHQNDRIIWWYFLIYTISAALFPVLNIFISKFIIASLINDDGIKNILLILATYFLASSFLGFLEIYSYNVSYPRITTLRINYLFMQFRRFLYIDYKYIEDSSFGDENQLAYQACSSNSNGIEQVYHSLFEIWAKVFSVIIYIIMVVKLSYLVLVAIVLSVFIGLLTSNIVERFRFKYRKDISHATRKRNYLYQVTHNFQYGKDIRLYHLQPKIEKRYHLEINNYLKIIKRIKNKEYRLGFVDLIFVLLSDLAIYGFLIYKFFEGMTIPDFSLYLGASIALSTTLKIIATSIGTIIYEGRYVDAFFKFLDAGYETNPGKLLTLAEDMIEIKLNNVSFKYPKTDKYIFKNLNLTINKGERLAIVGINGAGKTTLVKLLTRLFEIEEGEILINNQNIQSFDKTFYYSLFSVVFQNINIYAFPLEDNIKMGHDPNNISVQDAVIMAGLAEKINSLPKGLAQMMLKVVDEQGIELSGGENQKLAIARALYKNAKIVILDEPTAALDALAEAEIYQKFSDLVKDKTTIFISHRLASTKFCDKIALFSEDGLIEYGTHEQLMDLKKEYYQMFITQGQYYQVKDEAA